MPEIVLTTAIDAPPERCFDLARSIDLHVATQLPSDERAIAGKTSGLIELGESVTWRAHHFGVYWTLTSRITAFERPRYFQDRMEKGPFARLEHDHMFVACGGGTIMIDRFAFASPLGILGRIADRLLVGPHLDRLLRSRAAAIRIVAESDMARRFLRAGA